MKKVSSAISLAVASIALAASLVPAVVFANDSSTPDAYVEETEQSPTGYNGEDEANALSDNVALSAISINTNTYAHSATATSNGVTFTVEWNDSTTEGEATTFHITQTGGSSDAKVRMDVPMYKDGNESESVCDPSRGAWSGVDSYKPIGTNGYDCTFEFTASGTYRCLFYFMDTANNVYYLRTEASITVDDASRPAVSTIVSNAVSQAKQETDRSEYAMALWLHDWTLNQLEYDYNLNWCSAESGLTRGKGTCESYQRIYAKLLTAADIENGRIEGNGHTWNAVKIDGKWCQMDLTWDDSSDNWYDDFDQRHIYFGLTDELMAIAHSDHTANYQAKGYAYRSTDLSNNYFVRNSKADEWADAYKASIQAKLNTKQTSFSISATNASYPPGICGIQNGIIAAVLNEREWKTSDGTKVALNITSNVTTISKTEWTAVFDFVATYCTETMSLSGASVTTPTQSYTGSALTPAITVTLDGKTLVKGNDYTVSYERNGNPTNDFTSIGTITVIVAGKGAYTDTATGTFTISAASIANAKVTTDNQTYTGSALTPAPNVTFNGKTLTKDTDYTVAYTNNTNVGTATITITGKGNYTGIAKGTFTIKAANASKAVIKVADQAWTGKALTPAPTVTLNSKTLYASTDYTVSYSNNTNVGIATVCVAFKGNYSGSAKSSFKIVQSSIAAATVNAPTQTYTGSTLTPAPTVTLNGNTLTRDVDYAAVYSNNVNVGTATITVTGKGNYAGSTNGTFKIAAAPISSASVSAANQTYNGSALTPMPTVTLNGKTLTKDTDYTVAYSNNTNAGTATVAITGKGNYTGTAKGTFTIKAADASRAAVSTTNQTYNGSTRTPSVTVTLDGKTLQQGTDYTLSYSNNVSVGTATVTVSFKCNYSGSATGSFNIAAASISSASVSVATQTYNGSALTPAVTVTLGGRTLTNGRDYTVAYSNNVNPGTATVTVTGKGNYTGTAWGAFTIKGANSAIRLSGSTRYDTMASIVRAGFSSSKTVIIASGENFPDALGASSLAGAYGAPVILTSRGSLSTQARSEISRLHASKAFIVGGTAALSSSVESELRGMGLSVERLAGNTRQETATKIAAKTAAITKPSTVIIAAGKNYPDALSVSPYAYAKGYPIYLAEGDGSLSASTLNAIRSLGTVRRIIIVGGNAAIATSAESQLRSITSSAERWSGATRYETSLKIAEKTAADGMSWTTVTIASGQNFPDALAGASLVGKNKGILLLSAQNDGSSATGPIRSKKTSIGKCYILGGEAAITRGVESQVNSALS